MALAACAQPPPKPDDPRQAGVLERRVADLARQRAGVTDVSFVGAALWSPEDDFLREVTMVRDVLAERYGTAGRSIVLAAGSPRCGQGALACTDPVGLLQRHLRATAGRCANPRRDRGRRPEHVLRLRRIHTLYPSAAVRVAGNRATGIHVGGRLIERSRAAANRAGPSSGGWAPDDRPGVHTAPTGRRIFPGNRWQVN